QARGTRSTLQPRDVVRLEGDGDRLLRHTMFIRYSLITALVKMYSCAAVNAADIAPVRPDAQTQSSADLFLIFVGANVVATTFQVGASLAASFSLRASMLLIGVGSVAGAALVAALAPIGSRLRVPSVIAARPALGMQ